MYISQLVLFFKYLTLIFSSYILTLLPFSSPQET